jgi:ectoine hydroxylase-related dioxygenase (phytanoyl-CoA dioxygenase family)
VDFDALAREFADQGFCRVEGVLTPDEVAALRRVTDQVTASAAGLAAEDAVFDLEDTHTPAEPRVRRIKKPHQVDPLYDALARHPRIVALLNRVIGPDVRLHHSKVNMKSPRYGAPLEWHQDWAFIPHSNMSMAIAALMLDDVDVDNGPVLFIPGSHRGPLLDHHQDGYFVGAIDPATLDLDAAVPMMGPAGSMTLHHPMLVHGSALNQSDKQRRMLFYEYAAADAWPLIYGVDYPEYNSRMVSGQPTNLVRFDGSFVRMPQPTRFSGSIYNNQNALARRYFKTFADAAS